MAYGRRDIRGGAVQTTLNGGIASGTTSCVISAATGWPDGSAGSFYIVIDPGLATEEKILCSTRSSTTVNFTTRGADGTSAAAHSSGAVIYPCVTAVDIDEANYLVSKYAGLATAVGQVPVVDATNSIAMVQGKTSGQVLLGNGTTVASTALTGDVTVNGSGVTALGANVVSNTKLAAMTRGTVKIGNSSGAASDLALGTTGKVLTSDGTDAGWSVLPLGTLSGGYAQVTSSQGSITTITDLTSLTVTVTVPASARIKITGHLPQLFSNGVNDAVTLSIRESSTTLQNAQQGKATAGAVQSLTAIVVLTPSTGSHTYKLSLATTGGPATMTASSTGPAFILVENIGA